MRVSIEWFIADNFLMNAAVLLLAAAISGLRVRKAAGMLVCGLGAVYALLALSVWQFLLHGVFRLLMGAVLALGLRVPDRRSFARAVACILLSAMVLGGTMFALSLLERGGPPQTYGNVSGVLLGTIRLRLVLLALPLLAWLPHLFRQLRTAARIADTHIQVRLSFGDRQQTCTALLDTGNLLSEPMSNLPVMLVNFAVPQENGRPVPFCGISGAGELTAIRPARAQVLHLGAWHDIDIMVARAPAAFTGAQAILGSIALPPDRRYNQNTQKEENRVRRVFAWLSRFFFRRPRGLWYVHSGETLPTPLSSEEEQACILRLANGDEHAPHMLIEHNLRLVVYIARKFENTGICMEDLTSIGTIGLIKAVNTFDPEKKIKLATYASRCIENEILMHLRRTCRLKMEVSLDEPLNIDWDGNELLLSDILGTENDLIARGIEDEVDRTLLLAALKKLTPREQTIVQLRFGLNRENECTQKQVADILGISQSYISRLEKRIIKRLRKEIARME